jgi:N-acetylmuramoyl-L-alanine amidase
MEKDLVLLVSKQVTELLKRQYPEKNVVLSREDDVYLTLEERTTKANSISRGKNEDILYISIHANASLNSSAKGYEVWYLPPEYRRDLISPEEKEGYEETVIPILNTLLEEEYTVESILLAQSILTGLDSTIGTLSPNRGLLQEEWYVVRNARMPSVLIEIGFVTNKQEFQLLTSSEYLQKISQGIYTGITSFVSNFEEVR